MAITIGTLRARMERAIKERGRHTALAEHYKAVIADLELMGEEPGSATASKSSSEVLHETMEAIYEEVGKPLPLTDMFERLNARGIRVAGQHPIRNLGSHHSLDKERFANFGRGIWGLAKWKVGKHARTPVNTLKSLKTH